MSGHGKFSGRCDCYENHKSTTGRCPVRIVHDPTATLESDRVFCDDCRKGCAQAKAVVARRAVRDSVVTR